jgi:hypothetical protein
MVISVGSIFWNGNTRRLLKTGHDMAIPLGYMYIYIYMFYIFGRSPLHGISKIWWSPRIGVKDRQLRKTAWIILFSPMGPQILDVCLMLPSGKHTKNYGKSPLFMGKSTISMAMFNSELLNYQRLIIGLPNDLTRSHFDMFKSCHSSCHHARRWQRLHQRSGQRQGVGSIVFASKDDGFDMC